MRFQTAKMDRSSAIIKLYMAEPSGKKLDALYRKAWLLGLKTTYYLRSMGAPVLKRQPYLTALSMQSEWISQKPVQSRNPIAKHDQ